MCIAKSLHLYTYRHRVPICVGYALIQLESLAFAMLCHILPLTLALAPSPGLIGTHEVCCKCVASVLQVCCKCVVSVLQVCCKCVANVLQVCRLCAKCFAVCCKCVARVLSLCRMYCSVLPQSVFHCDAAKYVVTCSLCHARSLSLSLFLSLSFLSGVANTQLNHCTK